MKKIFIILFLPIILSVNIHAQVNYLPADSLLKWFENSHYPFDVWGSIRNWEKKRAHITGYNYKEYYQTPSLKPHLMKWLDRKLLKKYKIEQYINEDISNMDPDKSYDSIDHRLDSLSLNNEIKKLIKQQRDSITIDSLLANDKLFKSYKYAVIRKNTQESKVTYQKELNPFPDRRIVDFHMHLAYPESYEQIRLYWEETGRGTVGNEYFIPLVRLGDPAARNIYDKLIKKTIKNNCKDHFCHNAYSDGRSYLRGSYGTAKLVGLLEVDLMVDLFGYGDPEDIIPYRCKVIDVLLEDIFNYNIRIGTVVKHRDSCDEDLKHLKEIKKAAQGLIEYYKEQEYYWMGNMPFYEK